MECLRAKDQVDIGRPLTDFCAFLAGHTAAHTNNQIRIFLLQVLPATQLVEHLLLRFFANGAGVEQQYVRLIGRIGLLETVAGTQEIGHPRGIVFVHLAAVCLDKQLFGARVTHFLSM